MSRESKRENWSSNTGVILAVTGSAVGLANFLRFPGQAAQFGGGAFMLAYFVSLIILALPIAWAEWTMGRYGGQRGFSSCPGILNIIWQKPIAKYLGILGVLVPLIIYTYYSYVESWCLGYAYNFLKGNINFENINDAGSFWETFIGAGEDGSAIGFGVKQVGAYFLFATVLNFTLVYRGITKGIEMFCRIAVPTLIIIALVILVRVLTLGAPDASNPEQNIQNGLGFMWNPTKVHLEKWDGAKQHWTYQEEIIGEISLKEQGALVAMNPDHYRLRELTVVDQLKRPKLWLAAASQIFFSLSVGLGLIITYASYMRKDDDVVLSSLCASSANEFCEVGIGGMMTIPAAYAFLGAAGIVGQSTFALGFKTLPMVFSIMPLGNLFGFLFFFLLFLAAVNASISCLQPSIALLEETLNIKRKQSVAMLGMIAIMGSAFVVWFSKDAKALDTLDFWVGNLLVFIIATIQIIVFGWIFGVDRGFEEAHKGAAIKIPNFFKYIIKYVCPCFLLTIFTLWIIIDVLGVGGGGIDQHVLDLFGENKNSVAWISVGMVMLLYTFIALLVSKAPAYELKSKEKS